MYMDFFEIVNRRRSVRKFTEESIPEDVMRKTLSISLQAANSSNLQPWEFYWIRNDNKKQQLVEACFSQSAARTAQELVVAVSRIDTWKRNREYVIEDYKKRGKYPQIVKHYYYRLVPLAYAHDSFGILGLIKKLFSFILGIFGIFRPVPRGPVFRHDLFEIVTKTTALACQNFMLGLVAQGYSSCPMEGFDEKRVKKLLGLGRNSHIVMVLGVGKENPDGIYGDRSRIEESLVIKEV